MLKMLQCSLFRETIEGTEKAREPIYFHKGLNAVIGEDSGRNSIGKTTFLYIIDFIFGGKRYIDLLKDNPPPEALTNQLFRFIFSFQGKDFYFLRNTQNWKRITLCDERFSPLEEWPISRYHEWLSLRYRINRPGLSFRRAVGPYTRIGKREKNGPSTALRYFPNQKAEDSLEILLRLFNVYEEITEAADVKKAAKEKKDALEQAIRNDLLPSAADEKEVLSNEDEISRLRKELTDMGDRQEGLLLTVDAFKWNKIQDLGWRYNACFRKESQLRHQLDLLRQSSETGKERFEHEFSHLKKFFPGVNVERLETVESFHRKLEKLLRPEYEAEIAKLSKEHEECRKHGEQIRRQIQTISGLPTISAALLDEYADKLRRKSELETRNAIYRKKKAFSEDSKKSSEKYEEVFNTAKQALENRLNRTMKDINSVISPHAKHSPELTIKNSRSYTLKTPGDSGNGTEDRSLIIYDLACLSLTPVPFLIHDSALRYSIEQPAQACILNEYMKQDKQVFAVIDRMSDFPEDIRKRVMENAVIRLSAPDGKLFGSLWQSNEKQTSRT